MSRYISIRPRGCAIGSIIARSLSRSSCSAGPGSKPNTALMITRNVSDCMLGSNSNGSPTGQESISRSADSRITSA